MTAVIDEDEYVELMESLVALTDAARSEAYDAIARGEHPAAVALQYCTRLQDAVEHAQHHFPSEWRICP